VSEVKTINGREYTFKKYGLQESVDIKNRSLEIDIETQSPRVLTGTMQALTILHSIENGLKDKDGKEIPHTLPNLYTYFPPEDFDEAFNIAAKMNGLSGEEKNA